MHKRLQWGSAHLFGEGSGSPVFPSGEIVLRMAVSPFTANADVFVHVCPWR